MNDSSPSGTGHKRTILIVVGTVIGAVLLYLAFRDISWHDLLDGISQMKPFYLVPATGVMLLVQAIRAARLGLIVRPFCAVPPKALWDITNIWALANMVLPARLAEFVRPYLLRRYGASFSSGIGAIIAERVFDLSGLLLLFAVVLWNTPEIPRSYTRLGEVLLVGLLVGYTSVVLTLVYRPQAERVVRIVTGRLPERIGSFIDGIFHRVVEGLSIMASFRQAALALALSVSLWVVYASMTYLFLLAFSVEAPFLVAVTIQVMICLGVALPSAPGFVGTFHAVGRYALALFGVQSVVAVSFATVYHLYSLAACLVLGLISYWTSDLRFDQSVFSMSAGAEGHETRQAETPPEQSRESAGDTEGCSQSPRM